MCLRKRNNEPTYVQQDKVSLHEPAPEPAEVYEYQALSLIGTMAAWKS